LLPHRPSGDLAATFAPNTEDASLRLLQPALDTSTRRIVQLSPRLITATRNCLRDRQPRPLRRSDPKVVYGEEPSRRVVDVTRPASARFLSQSPSRFAPLGMPSSGQNRRQPLRGVVDRASSRETEPLTLSVAQLPSPECTDFDRRTKGPWLHPPVKESSASDPERLPPPSSRPGLHPFASWRPAVLRPRIPIDAF